MTNKKLRVTAALFLLTCMMLITGCSLGAGFGGGSPNATANSDGLPLPAKLAFGTVKLEQTQQALTAEQATKLLPLWKAARLLATTDSPAPGEVSAIYKQIEGEMSPEQMKIINGMTREDLGGISRQLGLQGVPTIQGSQPTGSGQGTGASSQTKVPNTGGGGFLPGFGGGGGAPRPQSSGTSQPRNSGQGRSGSSLPAAVYDALIKFLEKKVA